MTKITIDNVHEYAVTRLLVSSMERFRSYVDEATPTCVEHKSNSILGMKVVEDWRVPPNVLAFQDRYGNLVGLINMEPEPPEFT